MSEEEINVFVIRYQHILGDLRPRVADCKAQNDRVVRSISRNRENNMATAKQDKGTVWGKDNPKTKSTPKPKTKPAPEAKLTKPKTLKGATQVDKINACLSKKPITLDHLEEKTKLPRRRINSHLNYLVTNGLGTKTDKGFVLN
jgi:hypothetical protein